MIGNNEAYLIYNGKTYTKELFESKIKNHPKFDPSKAKFVGENPYDKKAPTPPPQAQPQVAQTPPPQETPQEGAFFEDAETQYIYDDMNSRTPEETRDMAMAVETGVAPQVAPQVERSAPPKPSGFNHQTQFDYETKDDTRKVIQKSEQQAKADAGAVIKKAVKRFADDYMSGTNIKVFLDPKVNFGDKEYTARVDALIERLADKIETAEPSKRRMLIEQRKKAMQLVQLMMSRLDANGELIVPEKEFKGKQAISSSLAAGKQDLIAEDNSAYLGGGWANDLGISLMPGLFQALREDEGALSEVASAAGDVFKIPGNVVAAWISSNGEDNNFYKQMGIDPKDKRARDQVLSEFGNILNVLNPNGVAGSVIGKIGNKLMPTGAKKLVASKVMGSTPGEESLIDLGVKKGANMVDDAFNNLSKLSDKGRDVESVSPGVKGFLKDSAVDIGMWSKDKAIDIASGTKGLAAKLGNSVFKSHYEEAPETFIRSLEYLTDSDERKAELLLELLGQTVVGSLTNIKGGTRNVSESSRVEKLLESGGVDNAKDMQSQLSEKGFTDFATNSMQSGEIAEATNLVADIYKEGLFKELNNLTGNIEIDLTEMVATLRANAAHLKDAYPKEWKAVTKRIDEVEALGKRGRTTADFKIGEETKQVNGREIVEDVTIEVDPTDMGSLGKVEADYNLELELDKTDFEDLKNINANMNKLKKDLENIRASDFQATSKQGIGGGQKFDQAESIQKEIDGLQSELDNLTPANFTESTTQMVGKGGELSKLKDELKNIKASDFTEEAVSYVNGKKVKTGGKTLNKEKFTARKLELEKKIKEVETSKGSDFDKKTVSSVDADKFNQYKNELSNTLKSLKEDLGVASKEPNYGASKTRSVTETDTDAMNQAKADLNDKIESERLAAGDAGRIGGEVIEDKAKNIQKLEGYSESLSQGVVPGSEKTMVSYDDLHQKLANIATDIFDKTTSATKATSVANALRDNVWKPIRNNLTKNAPVEDAKRIDELLEKAHVFQTEILSPVTDRHGSVAFKKLESGINKFVRGGKGDVALKVLAEVSSTYKIMRKAEYDKAIVGMSFGQRRILKKKYDKDVGRMGFFENAEMKELSIMLEKILKDEAASEGKKISSIYDIIRATKGLPGVALRGLIKGARKAAIVGSKKPAQSIEAISEVVNQIKEYSTGDSGETESIGASTKEPGYIETGMNKAKDVLGGLEYLGKKGKAGLEVAKDIDNTFGVSDKIDAAINAKLKTNEVNPKARNKLKAYAKKHNQDFKTGDSGVRSTGANYTFIDPVMSGMTKVYKDMGFTDKPTITSITDGKRDGKSYHKTGEGMDYRTKHLSDSKAEELRGNLQKNLGSRYKVIFHKEEDDEYHIHVQPSSSY
jgi:hypothetical protein